jgi:hypothetical protein
MNAVAHVLRLIAIVSALTAGFFYYQTNIKMTDLSRHDATLNGQLAQAQKDAADAQAKIDELDKQLDALKQKTEQDTTALKEAAAKVAKANEDVAIAQKDAGDRAVQVADLNGKLSASNQRQADYDVLQQKVATLEQDKKNLQGKLDALVSNVGRTSTMVADSLAAAGIVTPGNTNAATVPTPPVAFTPVSAKVLETDLKSGLIVFGAGKKNGFEDNIQLVVKKSGNLLGTFLVTDAQADLVVGVPAQGSNLKSLAKGDVVELVRVK